MKKAIPPILIVLLFTGCLADIRPEAPLKQETEAAGRALLSDVADAHGGRAAWSAHHNVSVEMRDTWEPLPYLAVGPWDDNPQSFTADFLPLKETGRLTFSDGAMKGSAWGIQNWKTYHVLDQTRPVFDEHPDPLFWVPTVLYFVEAPFRLQDGQIVRLLEPGTVDGTSYQRVFFSWKTAEPQSDVDQYIAWIDPNSKQLAYLQFTVRDFGPTTTGCMKFSDYKEFEGFKIATSMRLIAEPGKDKSIHLFEIQNIRFDQERIPTFFQPNPRLKGSKH